MATLVLTVVGGFIGGPVGAAIGASLGQQVDAAIFKPKGREGPRLADLKVQASTYGQQIPKLFGTMRVAGSVIWATDLIERRTKSGGGKGRPSVTEYSYAVSLAVALSSRPIRAIRRIWADGNLLRGTSGSFRERCIFRWHDGSEDQAVDPLIASAVGPGSASGFRGLAYAVFEELELAAFGNRIPSLTFEVEADTASVDAGVIGNALIGEAGRCTGEWPVAGYAASGDRARDALAPLFGVDGTRLVSGSDGWRLAPGQSGAEALVLADFRAAGRGEAAQDLVERQRAPLAALPGSIRLRHYEPERDYQLGQQMSQVAGGGAREERVDLPAVVPAASARALAGRLAAAASDGRETLVWDADLAALALPVGRIVTTADGSRWRVAARHVRADRLSLELKRHQPVPVTDWPAAPGIPVRPPDWPDATAMVRWFDLPNLEVPAATTARLLVAAAGSNDGWRGADCWFVAGPDAEPVALGTVRPALALGELAEPLAPGSEYLFDDAQILAVALLNPSMALESVDDAALLAGANRAMVGDELLQFGRAEPVDGTRWRLSRLLRRRAGSGSATVHPAGTGFVLVDDSAAMLLPPAAAVVAENGMARLQWTRRGDNMLAEVPIAAIGQAKRPLAPVHGRVAADGAGGLSLTWRRRSRVDPGWRDEIDQPVGEAQEAWRVALVPPVPGVTAWDSPAPSLVIAADIVAALAPGTVADIRQIGDFGLSPPLVVPLT